MTDQKVYRLSEVAKILGYCVEMTRRMIQDVPGVYRTAGPKSHYRIPAESVEILKQRLMGNHYQDYKGAHTR